MLKLSKISIPDKEIRRIAKLQKQLDVKQAKEIRHQFSSLKFGNARVQIHGLEEFESKSIEEYEESVRERLSQIFERPNTE